ncbi:hypothetical protein LTR27_002194 [Elasticomyces elasticus]|nr:hypothetical protein LTR27_002194 [Elasticomyces elasticus]
MASTSYLVDKLSTEIRLHIYGFLLGCSDYAKRPGPDVDSDKLISITLAATCRRIHDEVLGLFYDTKTVRLTVTELDVALSADSFTSFTRCVQLIDCVHAPSPAALRNVLYKTLLLPKIKAVTIAADCLAYGEGLVRKEVSRDDNDEDDEEYDEEPLAYEDVIKGSQKTVRQFAEHADLGKVVCVDVGRYKLSGIFERVEILHTKLLRMWPAVVATPDDYDAFALARDQIEEWDIYGGHNRSSVIAWSSHTSLQLWVGLLQASILADRTNWDYSCAPASYGLEAFLLSVKLFDPRGKEMPDFRVVPIRKLNAQCDPDLLDFWTEFLALNIATYREFNEMSDEEPTWEDARPHWCDLEGGEPVGLIKSKQNKRRKEAMDRRMAEDLDGFHAMLERQKHSMIGGKQQGGPDVSGTVG